MVKMVKSPITKTKQSNRNQQAIMKTRGKAKPLGKGKFHPINSLADDDISQVIKPPRGGN
jgi:hypothetical protein